MSEAAVLQALQCACSQDPAVLKVGEQQLKAWETEKGFYTSLAVSMNAREIMSVHLNTVIKGEDTQLRPGQYAIKL